MSQFSVSPEIEEFVARSFKSDTFGLDEVLRMLKVEPFSPDYYYMDWAARQLTWEACNGEGILHAQIGIDAYPCTKDCRGCSFAVSNNTRKPDEYEMPLDEIISYARKYVEQGANTLTVMITENYPLEQYLEYIHAIREAIGPDMPIMANMGDFDIAFAERLWDASVHSIFHSVRLGEGSVHSTIPIDKRFETLEAARSVGMKTAGGIEGIGPEFENEEVAKLMLRYQALHPEQSGACGRLTVPGTRLVGVKNYSSPKLHVYGMTYRLLGGLTQHYGPNCRWAEVGTNPRDHSNHTEIDGLVSHSKISVEHLREELENDHWKVIWGPVDFWK